MRREAEADLAELDPRISELEATVIELLVPPQQAEQRDIILEVLTVHNLRKKVKGQVQ